MLAHILTYVCTTRTCVCVCVCLQEFVQTINERKFNSFKDKKKYLYLKKNQNHNKLTFSLAQPAITTFTF